MMARPKRLTAWMYGSQVADIERRGNYDIRWRYTREAFERWDPGTPLVSCSLPVSSDWQPASRYLRGLLPEGSHLLAAAARAGVTTADTFGLLARFGRDVAGALVVTADDADPAASRDDAHSFEAIDDERWKQIVEAMEANDDIIEDDSELSLPGLQNKVLLVREEGRWARPTKGRPSTHILKLDEPRGRGVITGEYHASILAAAVGVGNAAVDHTIVGGRGCMIVERFDRYLDENSSLARLHQEDACQALGVDHEAQRGRGKYESAGGPTLRAIAGLFRPPVAHLTRELVALTKLVTFTVMIGNADAHGKNIGILHHADGTISLAPAYDVVPTALWPELRSAAAMSIGAAINMAQIGRRDIVNEARAWGLDAALADRAIDDVVERVVVADIAHDELRSLVKMNLDKL